MDDRMMGKYFMRAFAFRFLAVLLVGVCIVVGVAYMVLYVPMFLYDDYFEVVSVTGIMTLAFLISTLVVAPLEYRLDRRFHRTTLRFRGYLCYRLRSRIVFLIPLLVLLVMFTLLSLLAPSTDELSSPLTFGVTILAVLLMGLAMPKIYGSMLRKQEIENPKLLESIRELVSKMGIMGKVGGAYHVPVQGFKVANAAQLGFARKQRRIYLIGDIEKILTRGEVEAVIAHEFAHMKLRHILKLILILMALMVGTYGVFTFLGLLLLYVFSFGLIELTIESTLVIIVVLNYVAPLVIVYLFLFIIRRIYELEADQLAAKSTSPQHLSGALVKLAKYNLIPMKFPRIIGALMPHPSMVARLERLRRLQQTH
nr:M48 family metalloprotease [Candidatus Njordarchaeum guaymaensis]